MFEKKDYEEIENCGLQGVPLEHVGAMLNLTRDDFLKLYAEDKIARKSYERGESASALAGIMELKEKAKKDWKAQEYLLTNVNKLKLDPKKKSIEIKEDENTETWFDETIGDE